MKATGNGSLLLELLLATVISGIVISAAMESYRQILGIEQKVNRKNMIEFNLQRVQELITTDFSSAFIPSFQVKAKEAQSEEKLKNESSKKEPQEPILFEGLCDDFFYKSKIFNFKIARIDKVSFCATSPIIFGHSNPARAVRVTYLLEKSKKPNQEKDLFDLYRVETENLELTPDKKILEKAYKILLIKEIEEFSISFIPRTDSKNKDEDPPKEVFKWGNEKKERNKLPKAVVIRMALNFKNKPKFFEIYVKIGVQEQEDKKSESESTKKSDEQKKPEEQKDKKPDKAMGKAIDPGKKSEFENPLEQIQALQTPTGDGHV